MKGRGRAKEGEEKSCINSVFKFLDLLTAALLSFHCSHISKLRQPQQRKLVPGSSELQL